MIANSIIQQYFRWSNNENKGAEFQFLLTGDLSALKRSDLTVNPLKEKELKHMLCASKIES